MFAVLGIRRAGHKNSTMTTTTTFVWVITGVRFVPSLTWWARVFRANTKNDISNIAFLPISRTLRGKFYCWVATDKYCPWFLVVRRSARQASIHNRAMRTRGNCVRKRKEKASKSEWVRERERERERKKEKNSFNNIVVDFSSYKSHLKKKACHSQMFVYVLSDCVRCLSTLLYRRIFGCCINALFEFIGRNVRQEK